MKNFKNLLVVMLLFTAVTAFGQGVTTSSIGGKVTDTAGESLPGATVVAIHTPTGTKYGTSTDFDGFYRISNMRVGGPYKITISFVGFQSFENTNVFLTLGQNKKINVKLQESANVLDEVVIAAQTDGLIDGNKTGSETTIGQREIQTIAAASRSIADFVRLTPQVQISEGNDGFSISIAGQNNRYNAIYIDGAVSNDVFGLAGSGTNGGQTGVNPFSVDAIEQFQVNIAPFDVKISGFVGGAISAITRSGTNKWEASAYSFFRNENLAGKTPVDLAGTNDREKLDEFTALTYGVRVGGPIIKDKLFFFINYERQDDEIPLPFNIDNYGGSGIADINRLRDFVRTAYNYDIGSFDNTATTLESNKITARLDWNINDSHKLTARYGLVEADNLEGRTSDFNDLQFTNGSESFIAKTNSYTLEWNYQGKKTSNNFLVGYTRQRDDRDPAGDPFPTVIIGDGFNVFRSDGITFGAEPFSTANLLNTDIVTITNNFQVYSGKHTFTFGTHNEFASVKNLFFAFNFGQYRYNTIDDFINNTNLVDFDRGYSLLSPGAGDSSSGAAEFKTQQYGFYVQDDVELTDNFKFSAGVRVDIPVWEDGIVNNDFNTRAIDVLEAAGKDLRGARVGTGVTAKLHVAPRIGFNWNVSGDSKTQIRGGVGVFTSRLPLVWPGGTYNNNGVTGGFFSRTTDNNGNPIVFNPNVNQQPVGAVPGTGQTGGNVDLFSPSFQLPQVVKYNVVWDQRLPNGFSFTLDAQYNKNLNAVFYENLNVGNAVGSLAGADNRPFYDRRSPLENVYDRIILASNTSAGESYNIAFTARKNYISDSFNLYTQASYSYGDSRNIFDGTSSQNSSQWRNIITRDGKNVAEIGRSDFAQGHRALAQVTGEFKWNDNIKTTVSLFYDGVEGQPFSYIYNGAILNDDSRDNAIFFVPADASQINLVDFVDNGTTVTAAEQWTALNSFIEGNDYLRSRRGQYTERNGDRARWSHTLDLKVIQDFTINVGEKRHTLQFTADIFNFTNLINKNWGVRYFANTTSVVNVVGGTGTANPEFTFDPSFLPRTSQVDDRGIQSSRWQAQLGIRYIFD